MQVSVVFCVLVAIALVQATVHIRQHSEQDTQANQYLVYDDYDTTLLVNTGTPGSNTSSLVDFIRSAGVKDIDLVFLTSGYPAQWGGVPDIKKAFPDARVAVANKATYNELLASVALFPEVTFNYSAAVDVLYDDDTFADLDLTLVDNLPPAQANSYSLLINRDQNWIITGDSLYVEVHPYLGAPLSLERLQTWYATTLNDLLVDGELETDENTFFYPGHGRVGGQASVREFQEYLKYFETELFVCPDGLTRISLNEIADDLVSSYPDYADQEILEALTLNGAWEAAQNNAALCPDLYTTFDNNGSASLQASLLVIVLGALLCLL